MSKEIYIFVYIFVMAFATWCMRIIPSLVMKRPIQNSFVQSFLYYVPYVTLAVMTFPSIMEACESPLAGFAALAAGIAAAWFGASLVSVAAVCCLVVLILEMLLL